MRVFSRLRTYLWMLKKRFKRQQHYGKVLFVCSESGQDDPGFGLTIKTPLATIDVAVGMCKPGDTVRVLPGHKETYSMKDANIICDGISVSMVGKNEAARPSFGKPFGASLFVEEKQ